MTDSEEIMQMLETLLGTNLIETHVKQDAIETRTPINQTKSQTLFLLSTKTRRKRNQPTKINLKSRKSSKNGTRLLFIFGCGDREQKNQ